MSSQFFKAVLVVYTPAKSITKVVNYKYRLYIYNVVIMTYLRINLGYSAIILEQTNKITFLWPVYFKSNHEFVVTWLIISDPKEISFLIKPKPAAESELNKSHSRTKPALNWNNSRTIILVMSNIERNTVVCDAILPEQECNFDLYLWWSAGISSTMKTALAAATLSTNGLQGLNT